MYVVLLAWHPMRPRIWCFNKCSIPSSLKFPYMFFDFNKAPELVILTFGKYRDVNKFALCKDEYFFLFGQRHYGPDETQQQHHAWEKLELVSQRVFISC